jgi:hypothetical protein
LGFFHLTLILRFICTVLYHWPFRFSDFSLNDCTCIHSTAEGHLGNFQLIIIIYYHKIKRLLFMSSGTHWYALWLSMYVGFKARRYEDFRILPNSLQSSLTNYYSSWAFQCYKFCHHVVLPFFSHVNSTDKLHIVISLWFYITCFKDQNYTHFIILMAFQYVHL